MIGRAQWEHRPRRARVFGGSLAALATVWLSTGCPDPQPVPFKHDDVPPDHEATPDDMGDEAPKTALPEAQARSHDGGQRLRLPGGELELPGARASLSLPLDDDAHPDALVWAGDAERGFTLWRALGEAEGFGEPRAIDRSTLALPASDPPCGVADARLALLGAEKASLRVQLDCPASLVDTAREHVWVVGLSSSPRVLEHFALRLGRHEAPLELAELKADDVDGDQHADVQLVLRSSAAAADIPLTWLDRPSGLARDTSQPEASLGTLAAQAEGQLDAGDPTGAARTADHVLSVHGQLCREGESPQLGVAGTWGLRCGDSRGVARAALVALRARAAEGDVLGAFEALDALDREGGQGDPAARGRALKALSAAAQTPDYRLLPVAALSLPAQAALPPQLRLVDGMLWAGTQPPRVWEVPTRSELPSLDAPVLPSTFSDPSGQYRVRHIDRDCEGRLLRMGGPGGAMVRARIRDEALDGDCGLRLPVPDAADLRVLGWAPQGVVLGDREGALLVPLSAQAQPTEPPRRLPAETPLPAPLPAGRAAPAGQCYVLPSPHGVLLRRHGRDASHRLLRPPGWDELQGTVREAVVDATCTRFAIATSSHLYLIVPAAEGATAAPSEVGSHPNSP